MQMCSQARINVALLFWFGFFSFAKTEHMTTGQCGASSARQVTGDAESVMCQHVRASHAWRLAVKPMTTIRMVRRQQGTKQSDIMASHHCTSKHHREVKIPLYL